MTRGKLLLLGGTLIMGVGFLISSLAGAEFRGGWLPWAPPPPVGELGGAPPLEARQWILDVALLVVLALLAASLVALAVSREARREFLRRLLVLGVLVAVLLTAMQFVRRPEPVGTEPGPAAAFPTPTELGRGEEGEPPPPPRVPGWLAYVGAAVLTGLLALWAWRRFWPKSEPEADGIRDALAEASADLSAGRPVADVVIRCWARMVAVLSPRAKGADAPAVTPRELADRLVGLGFREEAVLVLTRLFEEVRYGHKQSEPRRAEALAALAAIERAYG